MNTLIHLIEGYVWGILFVVGIIVGAIVWLAMAIWDNVRGLFRKIGGEGDTVDHHPGL